MKIADLELVEFVDYAQQSSGITIDIGPFVVRLKSAETSFLNWFYFFYKNFPCFSIESFADLQISITRQKHIRRFIKPQVIFQSEGTHPFQPFPLSHALPLFEWGLNWCIARRSHQYLMLHSGVLEKNGRAIILPATPGSGKSTLSVALAMNGWRFLSDEFAILRPSDGEILPIPRPTPLKNRSIQVIKDEFPEAEMGPLFPKTRKGTVAHYKAPDTSVEKIKQTATPALVVFPEYQAGAELRVDELKKAYAFFKLASNSFNYELMGETGFKLINQIVSTCPCYNLTYSQFDQVIPKLEELIAAPA